MQNSNKAKYTKHFFTFSEKKPLTNLEKLQQQRLFSPLCMLLVKLASINVFYSLWQLEDCIFWLLTVCIGVSTPSRFLATSSLNQQTVQAPLFRQSSFFILSFREPSPAWKSNVSVRPKKFFIFNPILSFKSN